MKTSRQNLLLLPALVAALGLLPAGRVCAQNLSTLHSFSATSFLFGTNSDGAVPQSRLLLAGGTLYGTTPAGGTTTNGTVFAVGTNGTGFRILHYFTNSDGAVPAPAPLILIGSNLFGTTLNGGSTGAGTIYSLDTNGTKLTTIYNFSGNGSGWAPAGGLILSGNTFFGTTSQAGAGGSGTVYSVTTNGTAFKVLYSFTNTASNGFNPMAGLVLSGSTLYGVTQAGPASQTPVNGGTIFALYTNGAGLQILHTFSAPANTTNGTNTDGFSPESSLVLSGNTLYGTTSQGGSNGYGNIFAINTDGSNFRILYSFQNATDGAEPYSGVTLSGSTLFGEAALGGSFGGGTLYALNTDGTGFTLLDSFTGGADGGGPFGGLTLSGNTLYGTTDSGGAISTNGSVFSLKVPSVQVSATPTFGVMPVTVNFSSPSADNYANGIASWVWNFGDGTPAGTNQNPSHTYTSANIFSPSLQVVNNSGLIMSALGPPITVYAPTTIGFTASPVNGTTPLTVNFTSPAIDSATNAITSWSWNFGDGSTGTGQNPTHTYVGADTYYPTLNATNAHAVPVFASGQPVIITVYGATLQFTATPTNGAVPLTVNFNSPAVDNEGHAISTWNWSFGDGSTGTGRTPTHTYTTAGSYVPTNSMTNILGGAVSGFGPHFIIVTNLPVSSGLVLNGTFATGNFTGWTTNVSAGNSLNILVDNGFFSALTPYSGTYFAALGSTNTLSYLSQNLATSPGAPYLISLWLDSPDGATPNQFLVSWNGTNLFNQTNIPAIGWTNLQFLVTATAANTVLQIGSRDDNSWLGLDDVSVLQPTLSGAVSGTNLFLHGVNGRSGGSYYLMMGTNILEPLSQWTRIATNVVGTNGIFTNTVTPPASGATQRYYIIQFQ